MYPNTFDTTALSDIDVTTELIDSKENIHFKKESSPPPCSVITRRRIEAILEEQALRKQWEL